MPLSGTRSIWYRVRLPTRALPKARAMTRRTRPRQTMRRPLLPLTPMRPLSPRASGRSAGRRRRRTLRRQGCCSRKPPQRRARVSSKCSLRSVSSPCQSPLSNPANDGETAKTIPIDQLLANSRQGAAGRAGGAAARAGQGNAAAGGERVDLTSGPGGNKEGACAC